MFSKSFIIFGLLALFACQGATATQLSEIERASLGDLIKQVQQIISGLNDLVSGVLGDAISTLTNLVSTVASIKQQFLKDGINLISEGIGNVIEFVANKTAEAAELGIDITKCILGTNQTLIDLAAGFTANLTECVTDAAENVLITINTEIKNINAIIKTILAAPVKLSKCLITLRPISCVTKLLGDLTEMLTTLPGQILQIVDDAVQLVEDLPTNLVKCVANIGSSVEEKTEAMIQEIGDCVDDLISKETTAAPTTETTAAPTQETTAAPTPETTVVQETSPAPESTVAPISSRASLGDLIDQVKQIISALNELVTGVIGDAIGVLTGLVSTITEIKEKYLDDGIAVITEGIGNVIGFIKNKTEEAVGLGIDISQCVLGREEQLESLSTGLLVNLTDCVTTTVTEVLKMVNADLVNVNNIVGQVTGAPVKLAKCLISLKPVSCITKLLTDLTELLTTIPEEIKQIVAHASQLVQTLPGQLANCISNIATETATQTDQIITEIGDCVDGVISGTF